jgi:PIN domain nuclease of toxin-antitoxin system
MRYLLDTRTLLWAALEVERLSGHVQTVIRSPENEILVSAASAWEITTKVRLGRLRDAQILAETFVESVTSSGYTLLAISMEHALRAGRMPGAHKDPFDRMLAAQAIDEDIPLLSNDPQLDVFGVRREW